MMVLLCWSAPTLVNDDDHDNDDENNYDVDDDEDKDDDNDDDDYDEKVDYYFNISIRQLNMEY